VHLWLPTNTLNSLHHIINT